MTTTEWNPVVWQRQAGDRRVQFQTNRGVHPSVYETDQGVEFELWWDPKLGHYYCIGKAEALGIPMSPHTTLPRVNPGTGESVQIDEKLVDYIEHLWEQGIRTRACCQGNSIGGDPITGGMPGQWGYIAVTEEDVDKATPHMVGFGFDALKMDDRDRHDGFTAWRFKGLS